MSADPVIRVVYDRPAWWELAALPLALLAAFVVAASLLTRWGGKDF